MNNNIPFRVAQVIGASGEAEGLPLGRREPGAAIPPRAAPMPLDREALVDLIEEHLHGVYHCGRVWEAWRVGTMTEDDFTEARGSDLAPDLADAILAKLATRPADDFSGVRPPMCRIPGVSLDVLRRPALAATPSPEVAEQQGEREAFEAWADDQGFLLQRVALGDDYQDLRTQGPWEAWQVRSALASRAAPIDMVLFCPECGMQHIDAPESEQRAVMGNASVLMKAGWTNPPHRSHLCAGCGHIWRPADVPTNGVRAVKTKGKADSAFASRAALKASGDAALNSIVDRKYPANPQSSVIKDWSKASGDDETKGEE